MSDKRPPAAPSWLLSDMPTGPVPGPAPDKTLIDAEARRLAVEGLIAIKRFFLSPPRTKDETDAAEKIIDLIEAGAKLGIKIDGPK